MLMIHLLCRKQRFLAPLSLLRGIGIYPFNSGSLLPRLCGGEGLGMRGRASSLLENAITECIYRKPLTPSPSPRSGERGACIYECDLYRYQCEERGIREFGGRVFTIILLLILAIFIAPTNTASANDRVITVKDVVVDFAAKVDIPARQNGPIKVLSVRQNQWVSAGHVVAQLDDGLLLVRRRAASLKQESARLVLKDDVEIRYAETALAEAETELDDILKTSDRVNGSVARNQIRRSRLAVERAELELARVEKQRQQADIDLQLRAVDLESLDGEIERLQCKSPTDGIVLDVHRDLGEWIREGEPLVTIADASVLHLHALVDADQLDPARCVGLPVSVFWEKQSEATASSTTHSLRGKILSVDPSRLPGNRFRLHAEVTNRRNSPSGESALVDADGWQLVPGMKVTMNIHCSDAELAWRGQRARSGSLR